MKGDRNAPIAPDMQFANTIRLVTNNRCSGGYQIAEYLAGQLRINVLPMATRQLPAMTQPNPFRISNLRATPMQTSTQLSDTYLKIDILLVSRGAGPAGS